MNPQKQDVGVKISQPGYNALTAQDYNLIFSSSWPQLSVVGEYTSGSIAPINQGGGNWNYPDVTYQHNIGQFLFAMAWVKGLPAAAPYGQISNNSSHVTHDVYRPKIYTDKVIWNTATFFSTPTPPNVTVHIKVYNLDLTQPVSYPYKQAPIIKMPYDKDYGIKLAKQFKSIDSKDMRDFIIHSRCQSPQVDSVNVVPVGQTSVAVQTNNNYTNWVFGYGLVPTGSPHFVPAPADETQSQPWLRVNRDSSGNVVQGLYTLATGTTATSSQTSGAIVILRDPLLVANEVQVVY